MARSRIGKAEREILDWLSGKGRLGWIEATHYSAWMVDFDGHPIDAISQKRVGRMLEKGLLKITHTMGARQRIELS